MTPAQVLRPEITALSAYHVPASAGLVKLDAMENPYPLPDRLQRELADGLAATALNRYPDPQAAELKAGLRRAMGIGADFGMLLGNGSDEIIQMVVQAVARPGATLLSVEPAFVMFRMIATFCGMQYVGVPLREDFTLDVEAVLQSIARHRPAVIFLASPNNPTGNLFAAEEVQQIITAAPGLVVIDEAYFAFSPATFLNQLGDHPQVLLMRTVSKLGLAGLRLGLLIGSTAWLDEIDKVRLPYNINVLSQAAATFALRHYDVLLAQAARIVAERSRVAGVLQGMTGVTVFPSQANFLLFRVSDAVHTFEALKARGILVKNVSPSHPLLINCLRVTIGTPEENFAFLSALQTSL